MALVEKEYNKYLESLLASMLHAQFGTIQNSPSILNMKSSVLNIYFPYNFFIYKLNKSFIKIKYYDDYYNIIKL